MLSQIARFMGPTWGPPGSCRPQVGPMLALWTLLSGVIINSASAVSSKHAIHHCHLMCSSVCNSWFHDDVIKWKHFPRYWLAICVANSPVTGEFPAQMPVTRSFDVFFDPRLYKQLSKQSWGWWFETPSRSLWRHCNVFRWKLAWWLSGHNYFLGGTN